MGRELNIAGLLLNLIGSVVLYRYGSPPKVYFHDPMEGYMSLSQQEIDHGNAEIAKDRRITRLGFGALILGFACQLLALFL